MSDDKDICGVETTQGHPCKNNAGSCPWHNSDNEANTRQTELERNPDLIDKVADRLAAKDTVAEACAEIPEMTERKYYEWRRRAEEDGGIFREFREDTTRARKGAGRQDRAELQEEIESQGDTRTWYKLHMKQYGDQYGDEDMDMRQEGTVRQKVPEELEVDWYADSE